MPAKRFDKEGNRIIGIAKARNKRRKETWTPEQLEEKARKRQESRRQKRAQNYKPLTKEEIELVKQGLADKSLKMRYQWSINREKFCNSIKEVRSTKESRELTSKASIQVMSNKDLRKQISEKEIEYCKNPVIRERLRENTKKLFENEEHRKLISDFSKKLWRDPQTAEKIYNTKKENNTFNVSKAEEEIFELLCKHFGKKNIYRQYRDLRYCNPLTNRYFDCDFYIKSLDLFIEFQGNWAHGIEPFNSRKRSHKALVENWLEKSEGVDFKGDNKNYFNKAINTWTKRDPLKRKIAKQNNLNWLEFWSLQEVKEWLKSI